MTAQEQEINPPFVKKDKKGVIREAGFNSAHLTKLIEDGKIPQELLENHKKSLDEFKKLLATTPEESLAEDGLSNKISLDFFDKELQILQYLQTHAEALGFIELPYEDRTTLFHNVTPEKDLGISRSIGDLFYRIEDILKDLKLSNVYETLYEAKGSTKNSKGELISLVYSFQASNNEEALKIFTNYKKIMLTKGLRAWMAYWGMANKQSRFEFSCPMTEVMKLMSDDDRNSFFSVKEKQEHWSITKMLGMTKFLVERQIPKKGTKEKVTQWLEQPLLEIIGGEKESESLDKYPFLIAVRVLAPIKDNKKCFFAALYTLATLKLHPNDTLMAFVIQTRASQMGRGSKEIYIDWDYAFRIGNLEATAKTKKAIAKAQTRKKMDRFKEEKIIHDWVEELIGISITPTSQKRKIQSKEKS